MELFPELLHPVKIVIGVRLIFTPSSLKIRKLLIEYDVIISHKFNGIQLECDKSSSKITQFINNFK